MHLALDNSATVSDNNEDSIIISSAREWCSHSVPTDQSLGCLNEKVPVYFVVLLVFMIINITRSVITFPHTSSISPYKYLWLFE